MIKLPIVCKLNLVYQVKIGPKNVENLGGKPHFGALKKFQESLSLKKEYFKTILEFLCSGQK